MLTASLPVASTGSVVPVRQRLLPSSSVSRRRRLAMGAAAAHVAGAAVAPAPALPDLHRIKGILFDIDGTLCNSDPLHLKAFQELLLELGFNNGVPVDEAFFRVHISGRHNPEIAADLLPQVRPEWTLEQHREWYMRKEARFRELAASNTHPLPGLHDFLAWVDSKGLRKAAVTNAPRDNTIQMLHGLGLENYFEAVILGEECVRAKPWPDPYLEGLEKLGLQPHEALIVEDSPSGVRAGVAAGVPVIGLTSGQTAEVLREAGACHTIRDWHDMLQLVEAQAAAAASGVPA